MSTDSFSYISCSSYSSCYCSCFGLWPSSSCFCACSSFGLISPNNGDARHGTAPFYGTFKIPDSWFLLLQLQLRLVLCATGSSSVAVTTLGKWKGRGHAATGVGTLVICKYFNGTSQKTPKEQGDDAGEWSSRMGTRKPWWRWRWRTTRTVPG